MVGLKVWRSDEEPPFDKRPPGRGAETGSWSCSAENPFVIRDAGDDEDDEAEVGFAGIFLRISS